MMGLNMMKKFIISFILILCLLFSFTTFGFANETDSGESFLPTVVESPPPPPPAITVTIWKDNDATELPAGTVVTFYSSVSNAEYYSTVNYQWQISTDSGWADLEGQTGSTLAITLALEHSQRSVRLVIYYE